MSATLSVYAVSFERLRQIPGSHDSRLAEIIAMNFESFLSQIDELRDDDDEDIPTCRDAVAQIIDGAPLTDHLGYLYGYAFEAICAQLGRELSSVSSISRASRWIGEIDEVLKAKRISLSLGDLVYGRIPITLPTPDDTPYIGSWPPDSILEGLESIRRADLSGIDQETSETIEQMLAWLEDAASKPGDGLIGVLS